MIGGVRGCTRGSSGARVLVSVATSILAATASHAQATAPPAYRFGVGPYCGTQKYVGGERDRAGWGMQAGLAAKGSLGRRVAFAARGGWGRVKDSEVPSYRTTIWSAAGELQANLATGSVRPYVSLGGGTLSWKSQLDGRDLTDVDGIPVEGTEQFAGVGLGIEVDLADPVALDVNAAYDLLARENLHLALGGIGDANDARLRFGAGLLIKFGRGERYHDTAGENP